MLIEDLITRAPVTVPEGSRISLAARHMGESDVGSIVEQCIEKMGIHEVRRILVLDEEGELEGVVSLDDIVMHLSNTLEKAAALIRAEVARI